MRCIGCEAVLNGASCADWMKTDSGCVAKPHQVFVRMEHERGSVTSVGGATSHGILLS